MICPTISRRKMHKILLLLICTAGAATARVLNKQERLYQRHQTTSINIRSLDWRKGLDPIKYMTIDELVRQRVLLTVLDHVHQPLTDTDLLRLPTSFVMDSNKYQDGIDNEMLHVMELSRNHRVLGKEENYSILNEEHVRQMVGLYRLLVRSKNWDIFMQNMVSARRQMNGVLFVNALLLAISEHDDTKDLIMPGIHEILPEIYLDKEIIRATRNLDLDLLTRKNDMKIFNNTFEMIRLGNPLYFTSCDNGLMPLTTRLNLPWLQIRMGMEKRKLSNKKPFVVFVQPEQIMVTLQYDPQVDKGLGFLLHDIGFLGFVQYFFSSLYLKELEKVNNHNDPRIVSESVGQSRPTKQDRNRWIDLNADEEKPNKNLAGNKENINWHDRYFIQEMGDFQGRHDVVKTNEEQNVNENHMKREQDESSTRGKETKNLDQTNIKSDSMDLPTTNIHDQRLLHINRRRLFSFKKAISPNDRIILGQQTMNISEENRVNVGNLTNNDSVFLNANMRNTNDWDGKLHQFTTSRDDVQNSWSNWKDIQNDNLMPGMFLVDDQPNLKTPHQNPLDSRENMGLRNFGRHPSEVSRHINIHKFGFGGQNFNDLPTTTVDNDRLLHINRRCLSGDYLNRNNNERSLLTDEISNGRRITNDEKWLQNVGEERLFQIRLRPSNHNKWMRIGRFTNLLPKLNPRDSEYILALDHFSSQGVPRKILLHNLQQLVARLNLERISLGLTETPVTESRGGAQWKHWKHDMGMEREDDFDMEGPHALEFEKQIAGDKLTILNFIRQALSESEDPHDFQLPLKDLGIALNDPFMYKVMARLLNIIDAHRTQQLGVYSSEDVTLEGVTISDITVDRLQTYVDSSDIDLTNLIDVSVSQSCSNHRIPVTRQQRLNHKDFTVEIDLTSDNDRRVEMRILLGPKINDEFGRALSLNERRLDFMLLDTTVVDLQQGRNLIRRRSRDIRWTAQDTTPFMKIYAEVLLELHKKRDHNSTEAIVSQDCRFPHRLILPKGHFNGLPMELLVILTPAGGERVENEGIKCGMGIGDAISGGRSLGFPLDRGIEDSGDYLSLPNIGMVDVAVYHED